MDRPPPIDYATPPRPPRRPRSALEIAALTSLAILLLACLIGPFLLDVLEP